MAKRMPPSRPLSQDCYC